MMRNQGRRWRRVWRILIALNLLGVPHAVVAADSAPAAHVSTIPGCDGAVTDVSGGVITGRVVDAETDAPLQDVIVTAIDDSVRVETRTLQDGSYALAVGHEGPFSVSFDPPPPFAFQFYGGLAHPDSGAVVRVLNGGHVTGIDMSLQRAGHVNVQGRTALGPIEITARLYDEVGKPAGVLAFDANAPTQTHRFLPGRYKVQIEPRDAFQFFASTFFPSTPQIDDAQQVTITAGLTTVVPEIEMPVGVTLDATLEPFAGFSPGAYGSYLKDTFFVGRTAGKLTSMRATAINTQRTRFHVVAPTGTLDIEPVFARRSAASVPLGDAQRVTLFTAGAHVSRSFLLPPLISVSGTISDVAPRQPYGRMVGSVSALRDGNVLATTTFSSIDHPSATFNLPNVLPGPTVLRVDGYHQMPMDFGGELYRTIYHPETHFPERATPLEVPRHGGVSDVAFKLFRCPAFAPGSVPGRGFLPLAHR